MTLGISNTRLCLKVSALDLLAPPGVCHDSSWFLLAFLVPSGYSCFLLVPPCASWLLLVPLAPPSPLLLLLLRQRRPPPLFLPDTSQCIPGSLWSLPTLSLPGHPPRFLSRLTRSPGFLSRAARSHEPQDLLVERQRQKTSPPVNESQEPEALGSFKGKPGAKGPGFLQREAKSLEHQDPLKLSQEPGALVSFKEAKNQEPWYPLKLSQEPGTMDSFKGPQNQNNSVPLQ